ncbi:MBL fold metallo-hydrolase [Oscillatoria laete-virens NRMC-F 0139]|nr:MBL fold metallo-hydrolase [Oscillatoria laete-virens NRMC-F 0139]
MPPFFGTGHGHACGNRFHTAMLLQPRNAGATLIDCGEPVTHLLKKKGTEFNSIDQMIISHLHGDHVGGFHMLIQGMWLERRKRPLPIYLPEEGIEPLQAVLKMGYLDESLIGFKIQWIPLKAGAPIKVRGAEFTPHVSTHLDVLRELLKKRIKKPFQAFCFDVKLAGFHLGLSMDIGAPDDLEPLFKKPLDLLVCELAHFDPADFFDYLKSKPFGKLLMTHVDEHFYRVRPRILAQARKVLGKNVMGFAKDGMTVPLD